MWYGWQSVFIETDTPGLPWREEGILEAFLFDSHSSICRIKRTKIYVILD